MKLRRERDGLPRPKICVASTLAAYKCEPKRDIRESQAWLSTISEWRRQKFDIEVLAVLQAGQGHDEAFDYLRRILDIHDATIWTFSVDDGEREVSSHSRIPAICMGRNLAHEFVVRRREFTHLLLLDSDVQPPPDGLKQLLEVDHPIVGGHVPTYCLDGPRVRIIHRDNFFTTDSPTTAFHKPSRPFPLGADVREHWNTAGALLLERDAVLGLRWGWNPDQGKTDDPWFQDRAVKLGFGESWVRHDSIWTHHPQSIGPLESRNHDLSILSS